MDNNPRRYCTVPSILGFREWFEKQYGDLCEVHDREYVDKGCLICADIKFISGMVKSDWKNRKRNLFFSIPAAPVSFLAFTGFKITKLLRF